MRKVGSLRLITLSILLAVTAIFVYLLNTGSRTVNKEPINSALVNLPGWIASPPVNMGSAIEQALFLDDYLFRTYQHGLDKVTLYIGYYHSAAKVGAAHDPLVCFTGQGWRLTQRNKGTYRLIAQPAATINYASMIAEQQSEKELIIYWFQTNDTTSSNTASQKVAMAWDRLRRAPEESAFVRLSTRLGDGTPEAARKRIFDFVEVFYPAFYRYVTGS